ncbi:MAG: hypothetical protein QG551_261 [Patescibacteria group bacterium]|jgi:hypothetical protein|nr:hypothetical protein [Patescibacteria group bacterium]
MSTSLFDPRQVSTYHIDRAVDRSLQKPHFTGLYHAGGTPELVARELDYPAGTMVVRLDPRTIKILKPNKQSMDARLAEIQKTHPLASMVGPYKPAHTSKERPSLDQLLVLKKRKHRSKNK